MELLLPTASYLVGLESPMLSQTFQLNYTQRADLLHVICALLDAPLHYFASWVHTDKLWFLKEEQTNDRELAWIGGVSFESMSGVRGEFEVGCLSKLPDLFVEPTSLVVLPIPED